MNPNDTNPSPHKTFFGARSEESALFRAESLGGAGTAALSAESSGFIQIDAYRRARAHEPSAAASFEQAAGLGGLGAASSMMRPIEATRRPRGLLKGTIAALSVAIVTSLIGLAMGAAPEPAHAEVAVAAISDELAAPAADEDDDDEVAALEEEDETDMSDEDDGADEADEDRILSEEELAALTPASKRTSKRKSTSKRRAAKASKTPKPAAAPKPATPTKSAQDKRLERAMSVECLLNPERCKSDAPRAGKTAPDAPSLPSKLSLAQLKEGTSAARTRAQQQCADRAGPGDKVQVKLSIAGSTGKVVQTSILGDASGTALGACVARELKTASFDRSGASRQGTMVTIRF